MDGKEERTLRRKNKDAGEFPDLSQERRNRENASSHREGLHLAMVAFATFTAASALPLEREL